MRFSSPVLVNVEWSDEVHLLDWFLVTKSWGVVEFWTLIHLNSDSRRQLPCESSECSLKIIKVSIDSDLCVSAGFITITKGEREREIMTVSGLRVEASHSYPYNYTVTDKKRFTSRLFAGRCGPGRNTSRVVASINGSRIRSALQFQRISDRCSPEQHSLFISHLHDYQTHNLCVSVRESRKALNHSLQIKKQKWSGRF